MVQLPMADLDSGLAVLGRYAHKGVPLSRVAGMWGFR
jgi:hypothetical protein